MFFNQTLLKTLILVFWAVLIYVLLLPNKNLYYDNSKWLGANNPVEKALNLLESKFQPYENVVLAYDFSKNIFNQKTITSIRNLGDDLKNISGVNEVLSPLTATVLIEHNSALENITYEKAIDKNYYKNPAEVQENFLQSPYYLKIVSKDLTKVSLIVKTDTLNDDLKRNKVIENIQNIVKKYSKELPKVHFSGDGILKYQLNLETQNDLYKLVIINFFIIGIIAFALGGYRKTIMVWGVTLITLLTCLFVIGINEHPLTSLSIALIVMVNVVGVSDAFHIIEYFQHTQSLPKYQRISKLERMIVTIKATIMPCFLTSLTTAVGFGTFMFSDLIPLNNFGLDASISIMFSYLFNMLLMASLLLILPMGKTAETKNSQYTKLNLVLLEKIFIVATKYPKRVIITFLVLMGLLLSSLPFAKTESNFLDVFFAKKSNFYQDFTYLDRYFKGSNSFNIILDNQSSDYFKTMEGFNNVKFLVEKLESLPLVNATESYLLPLKMVHEHLRRDKSPYPVSEDELAQELLFLDLSRTDNNQGILTSYIDFTYQKAHIKLQTNNLNSEQLDKLVNEIQVILKDVAIKEKIITGNNEYFNTLSKDVLSTQFISIVLCFFIIFGIFFVVYKIELSLKATLVSAFPIVFVLSSIVLSTTPFDFAVVLVSSVTLGLSVDNTLHILSNFLRARRNSSGLNKEAQLKVALFVPGLAITQAALLFCITALIFTVSDLVLLKKFGIFTAITIMVAFLTSTLFFLALLRSGKQST